MKKNKTNFWTKERTYKTSVLEIISEALMWGLIWTLLAIICSLYGFIGGIMYASNKIGEYTLLLAPEVLK